MMNIKMSGDLYDDIKKVHEAICYLQGMVDILEKECMERDKNQVATELFIRINGVKMEITKMVNESDAFCPLSVNLVCSKITPATKEQRDLLFQEMHEAGYEWDSEKRKLKKIEQVSNWSEENEGRLKSCLNILQPKTFTEKN